MPDWFFADYIKFLDENNDQIIGVDYQVSKHKSLLDAGKVQESGAELLIDILETYKAENSVSFPFKSILPFI